MNLDQLADELVGELSAAKVAYDAHDLQMEQVNSAFDKVQSLKGYVSETSWLLKIQKSQLQQNNVLLTYILDT